ncbi:MAG: hypothetical protein CVV27_00560 [Candidatus Melainabacteria bacterium HGW-Melainabacteria-1]|nr:MAG: hypothetical protein CVV27_00560 [Candidatus Melainabacteria bacterium HGW-Melainabacteria-1]
MKKLLAALSAATVFAAPAIAAPLVREIAPIGSEPGQVLWLGRQALVSRQGTGEILIWDQKNLHALTRLEGCRPSGMIATRDRHFLLACTESPRLLVMNDVGQVVETFPRPEEERGLVRLADQAKLDLTGVTSMARDARGGVYVAVTGSDRPDAGSRGKGRIYYLSPSRSSLTALASNLDYPAGLALSADGKSLFVSEGFSRQIRRFDAQPGVLSNPSVIARIPELYQASASAAEEPWPGALAFNSKGHLYIALSGDGRILVASPEGKRLAMIEMPVPYIQGFSFSRTDRIMYVTGSRSLAATGTGSLYEIRL